MGEELPFGGGSGGGVSIQPVGFLVVHDNNIRFQMVNDNALWDRLISQIPEFILDFKQSFSKNASENESLYTDDCF